MSQNARMSPIALAPRSLPEARSQPVEALLVE
jgi:hypothetical protein